jgi:hypothetical protein
MIISVLKIFFLDATFLLRFSVYYCIHSIRIKKSQPYSSRTYLNDFVFSESKYSFRYFNIVEVSQEKTTTYDKNSFKYTAAILWNDLPYDILKNWQLFYVHICPI